jgi:hypothetical protein
MKGNLSRAKNAMHKIAHLEWDIKAPFSAFRFSDFIVEDGLGYFRSSAARPQAQIVMAAS